MAGIANEFTQKLGQSVSGVQNAVQNAVQNSIKPFSSPSAVAVTNNLGQSASSFPSQTAAISTSFLNSNTMIAKVAFVILVIVFFMVLVNLAMSLFGYFLQPASSPYIVYGTLDGNDSKIVPVDPKQSNNVNITRSNDQTTGAEFSYAVWLFVTNKTDTNTNYQHIFNKGDTNFSGQSVSAVNNAPGLYLTTGGNTNGTTTKNTGTECILHVVMDTVDPTVGKQTIDVVGIPYHQWVHVVVRLENLMLDIYVNGIITNRVTLPATPKQNYNDINLCQNNGFSGKLSNLRYYNYALSAFEINAVVMGGPNTQTSTLASNTKPSSPYFLSSTWYTSQY